MTAAPRAWPEPALPEAVRAPAERWRRDGFNVARMRLLARRTLPRAVFDFADGGAEDERTLRRNEAAFADHALVPRPLDGSPARDLSVELFGRRLAMPLMIGPTGLAGLFWPGGELAAARAAHAAGTAYCLSHGSVCTLEDLAATGAAPRWFQNFVFKDRGFTRELTARAAAAGYDALVLTVDNQLLGSRERDLVNGFTIPPRLGPAQLAAMATRLPWLWRMRRELPRLTFGNYVRKDRPSDIRSLAGRMPSLLDPGLTWADVDAVRAHWPGPLLLKGILHPGEAAEAVVRGIDGVIVSNHGGRQLDGAIASLDALPDIVAAVAGRIPVLLDGGVRRGTDIVKALALGARCCLIGRPHLWALAVAGEAGVAHVLELYRRELDRALGLCGLESVAEIGPELLLASSRGAAAPVAEPARIAAPATSRP